MPSVHESDDLPLHRSSDRVVTSESTITGRPLGVGVVVYRRAAEVDAIDEYSRRLVGALCESGIATRYVSDGLSSARRQFAHPRWLLLQYNPFSWGHWGIAPGLLKEAIAVRRQRGVPLAVFVHEAWVEATDPARSRWRSTIMGTYQRAQLAILLTNADIVMAATEAVARKIGRDAVHVPAGTNVTPLPLTRKDARQRLGLGDEIVICLFGRDRPSRASMYSKAAISLLAEALGPTSIKVLNLGHGVADLDVSRAIPVETPGHLEAGELSVRLLASDILLLPFTDGLSTGRTTLMAALAHGLPVVGLCGRDTDAVLIGNPEALTLTPLGDVGAFTSATLELASAPDRLRATGEAGRELYAKEFDWPVIAQRVQAALMR